MTRHIMETWHEDVLLPLGHFANVIEIGGQGIAFSTDGVGSKTIIAQMLGKYDTIGIDCVAMNVNDLLCVGAKPSRWSITSALNAWTQTFLSRSR